MAARNIYVRSADETLWDEAEKLASNGLSRVITELLRGWVTRERKRKESSTMETERIEFELQEANGSIRKKTFDGRWVVDIEEYKGHKGTYSAAITARNQIFLGHTLGDGYFIKVEIIPSVDALPLNTRWPADLLDDVATEMGGEYVEHLDI